MEVPAPRHIAPFALALLSALVPTRAAEAWDDGGVCVSEPVALWSSAYTCGGSPYLPPAPLRITPETPAVADAALLGRARQVAEMGRVDAALELLEAAEIAYPEVYDHIALLRGDLSTAAGRADLALEA